MSEISIIFIIIIILLLYIIKEHYKKQKNCLYIINLHNSETKIINIVEQKEYYNNINLDYNIIHDRTNKIREENVLKNQKILGKRIKIFDAVMLKEYDPKKIKQKYELDNINESLRPGEVGCFLSHYTLLKSLPNEGYSVIFEDDLEIIDQNLHDNILKIINNVDKDFDLIFLGNLNDNHGKNIKDNLYEIDKNNNLWGTQAYLVNNKKIPIILSHLKNFSEAVDNVYADLSKKGKLKSFVIFPIMVGQLSDKIGSTIR